MTENLIDFYKNVRYIDERLAIYEDDKGNYVHNTPATLLVNVQYHEMTKDELEKAIFNQLVPKDMIFKEVDKKTIVPKNEITGKDEDKYTLVDKIVKAKQVWIMSNSLGVKMAFNSKEEAEKVRDEINSKIYEVYKIEVK